MRVKLTSAAFADVARILDWYDAQAPGIGARFLNELDGLTLRLANNPAQFPAIRGDVRRAWFSPSLMRFFSAFDPISLKSLAAFMRDATRSLGSRETNDHDRRR